MSKRDKNDGEDHSIHSGEAEEMSSPFGNGVASPENESGESADTAPQEAEQAEQPESGEEGDELSQLQNRIKELESELSELKDQYLRKQADFENYRKRMRREKEEAVEYANQQLLLDIITIIDDFERAIKSAEESRDFDSFHDGIVLIEKQFTGLLERKWGLRRFDSEGDEFDPQKHEAVATEDVESDETARVIEDYQKGYFLNDRVLRSAKVKVSVPGSGGSEEIGGEAESSAEGEHDDDA